MSSARVHTLQNVLNKCFYSSVKFFKVKLRRLLFQSKTCSKLKNMGTVTHSYGYSNEGHFEIDSNRRYHQMPSKWPFSRPREHHFNIVEDNEERTLVIS